MKKLTAVLVAILIIALSSVTAFAAGINSAEQRVLDVLNSSVTMKGSVLSIPSSYVNQAEAFFNTIEMTDAQADEIVAILEEGRNYIHNSEAENILHLSFEDKQFVLDCGQRAVAVLGATLVFDTSTKNVIITDADGTVLFTGVPHLTPKGEITQDDVIKTTGFGADTSVAVAGGVAFVLLMVFGGLYLVKTKKSVA